MTRIIGFGVDFGEELESGSMGSGDGGGRFLGQIDFETI